MTDNREFLSQLFADPDEQPHATGTEKPAPEQRTASEFLRNLFQND